MSQSVEAGCTGATGFSTREEAEAVARERAETEGLGFHAGRLDVASAELAPYRTVADASKPPQALAGTFLADIRRFGGLW